MRALILRFDSWLSRREGIFEFTRAQDCLLRLQIARASRRTVFSEADIGAGEGVLAIHLWNDHIPPLPSGMWDLAWAARTGHLFVRSLHAAGEYVRGRPDLARLRAVRGTTAIFSPFDPAGGAKLMRRLGFAVLPYASPLGRFGEFWENFYSWWIIWAYNPAALRGRGWLDLRRSDLWMPMGEFLRRYGKRGTEPSG